MRGLGERLGSGGGGGGENVRTVAHDHGGFPLDGLGRYLGAEIVCQEDRFLIGSNVEAKSLLALFVHVAEEETNIVPGLVSQLFGVPGRMTSVS